MLLEQEAVALSQQQPSRVSDVPFDNTSLGDVRQELEDTRSYHCCWVQLKAKGYGQQRSKGT